MKYETWISFKYLRAKKDRFLSVINFISIAGVAIGVMALIIVISVMTGFDSHLTDKIIGTSPNIIVEKETGVRDFTNLQKQIKDIPGVQGASPYVQGNVFLESDSQAKGLTLRGVDPKGEFTVIKVNDYLKDVKIQDLPDDGIIIGSQLASFYGFQTGDTVTLIAPASGVKGQGWRYQLKVFGIFNSGIYDVDMDVVLVDIKKAQEIFDLPPNVVTGIGLKLADVYAAPQIKKTIDETFQFKYLVRTWIQANENFFAALRLEKFAMFVILTLIVLVASFNIASTLIVTVTTKIKDIGILKSIGVPKSSIRRIFTFLGLYIGFMGTFWGLVGGVGVCLLLKKYQFIEIPKEIYYFDRLPVTLQLNDILTIVGSAMAISFLATIYPAIKAASLEPVDALRYE